MENLEQLLNLVSQLQDNSDTFHRIRTVYPNARKEFDALKAAGVEVKIEQVEHVTVVKSKSKRGGYRPRTKKSSQSE